METMMNFDKKTIFMIVLLFLGILLFMYFRNSGMSMREGYDSNTMGSGNMVTQMMAAVKKLVGGGGGGGEE